jgi:hypothetical protein
LASQFGNQVGRNVVADADVQVVAFFDQVHQAVEHVEADVQRWVAVRQF